MAAETTIRPYDHKRDERHFLALNFETFRNSVPPGEPVPDEEFRNHYRWLISRYAPWDSRRNTILVAEVEGRYAGHCWIGSQVDFFTRLEEPWIYDLSVVGPFRKRGVGRALLAATEELLRDKGHAAVGLQVMAHNPAARKLYEAAGYAPRAVAMRKRLG